MSKALTDQERLFAETYVRTHNGRQSAILSSYSETNASQTACRLLKRPRIIAEIQRLQALTLDQSNVSKSMVEAFYINLMADKTLTPDQRMKAADLLCKLRGYYMRSLDKLLAMGADEIRSAVREVQETHNATYQLTNGK